MITHVWTVVCSHSVIDQDSRNVSLFNVIELVRTPEPVVEEGEEEPIVPLQFDIVSLWVRMNIDTPSQGRARFVLETPSGKEILPSLKSVELDVDLGGAHQRARTRLKVSGLPVPEAGRYWLHTQLQIDSEDEWRNVAKTPLQIVFASADDFTVELND